MSPTRAWSRFILTTLTIPKPRNHKITPPLCGPFWMVPKSNLRTKFSSWFFYVTSSTGISSPLDEDIILTSHITSIVISSILVITTQPCFDTKRRRSYENRQRIHYLMWTLASMFHISISHLLTVQHLQDSNWLPTPPDSLTIQRLTDTMTQQFNNTHFRSCISILMQFQKKFSFLFTEYVHPRNLKQFLPLKVPTHPKRESEGASIYCLYSP